MMATKAKERARRRKRMLKLRREKALDRLGEGLDLPANFTMVRNLGGLKMSKVLLEFAEPILEEGMALSDYEPRLTFAVIAWNAAIPGFKQETQSLLRDFLAKLPEGDAAELEGLFHFLLARKRAHFSHVNRLIMNVIVSDRPGEYNVQVLSVPLDPPA